MTTIEAVTLEVADAASADTFYREAFGLGGQVRVRQSDAPTEGFRGFTLSLTVSQPGNAAALLDAAVRSGATVIKPAAKSLWGFGGTVQAPDGTIWKVATTSKKDTAAASRRFDGIVLLLGVDDVSASKRFYLERGLKPGKSFGSYVEFDTGASPIKLGLYKRRALAKDAGVPEQGSGSHRIAIAGDAAFTDPDGFAWEALSRAAAS
jgi:uncharacterized glyoxalase superfamily protein PhnB